MGILERFNQQPFQKLLGIEITEAADGDATGELRLRQDHSSNQERLIAHGGVAFALADSVGGAAAVSLCDQPTPTIDFRIDYLNPATDDLVATGEVVRDEGETALVDVRVHDESETSIATARGLYKMSGHSADTPWGFDEG